MDTLTECMAPLSQFNLQNAYPTTVHRVHWLRARAQSGRWSEEAILVGYEMQWSIRYFLHKAQQWDNLCDTGNESSSLAPGPAAYAARKAAMWRWVALKAKKCFLQANPNILFEGLL